MRFLVFFLFIACSGRPDSKKTPVQGLDETSVVEVKASPQQTTGGQNSNEKAKINKQEKKVNALKNEENALIKQRKQKQKRLPEFVSTIKPPPIYTICRRFDGCQRFCTDWLQNTDCNQWTISTVVSQWSALLSSLSSETLMQNVEWLAMHQDVSVFLREADAEQSIIGQMIARLSYESCPLSEGLNIHYSADMENLYLVHPEGQKQGMKKITDSRYFDIDVNMFKGSLKKCLDDQQFSLPELMMVHKNKLGFQLMHQKIAESCGDRSECVQLAYCKMNSEPVWTYLEQVKDSDEFNMEIQNSKCSYEDFNSLPSMGPSGTGPRL